MTSVKRLHNFRKGDSVIVIAGGNSNKRPIKGKVAKIVEFVGKNGERVVLEGLNMMTKHVKARGPNQKSDRVKQAAPMHYSNVMYYVEKLKAPVKLRRKSLADGKRVRGYNDPKSKEFVQIAEK